MKRLLIAMAAAVFVITTAVAATNVGVSVSIGQPNFYGQIDIVDFPQPQVVFAQPMIIHRGPANRPPLYLHVPPDHAKHWSQHCRAYNACSERVFFVQDDWYEHEYVPRYQERHGISQEGGRNDGLGNQGNDQHRKGNEKGNDEGRGRDR
jgi:hypothetical protein